MPSGSIDILGNLKLSQWYKIAIYLGVVLLVLDSVAAKINNVVYVYSTNFAVESLVLGLIAWILDDSLYAIASSRIDRPYSNMQTAKNGATLVWSVRWIGTSRLDIHHRDYLRPLTSDSQALPAGLTLHVLSALPQ